MNALEKLIENDGWRPIEECTDTLIECVFAHLEKERCWVNVAQKNGKWFEVIFCEKHGNELDEIFPTHFMPLDTPERMTKVIQSLVTWMRKIEYVYNEWDVV